MNKNAKMAKQHCKTLGGRLFEPQSEEENKKVAQALRDYMVQGQGQDTKSVSIEFILCFTTGCFISDGTVKNTDLSADAHVVIRKICMTLFWV